MSYDFGLFDETSARLAEQAYDSIERTYGLSGATPKPYHNVMHARDVVLAAESMAALAARNGRTTRQSLYLLRVAGAFHDYNHSLGTVASEQASADAAEQAMRRSSIFTDAHLAVVRRAIMATVVKHDNGIMKQSADGEYTSRILADADLAVLGQPTALFWDRVSRLYNEYHPGQPQHGLAWQEFNLMQVGFIENHRFYTDEADQLFPHQDENLASVHEAIRLDRIPA